MKKRKIAIILLATIVLGGCGNKEVSADKEKESVETVGQKEQNPEDESGFLSQLEEELDRVKLREDYYRVDKVVDSENPENNQFYFVGRNGSFTITGYDNVNPYYNGVACATTLDGDEVIIDMNGKILSNKYDFMFQVDEAGHFSVKDYDTDKEGIINKNGKEIVPCEYDDVSYTSNDYAYIFYGDKEGVSTVYTDKGLVLIEGLETDCFEVMPIRKMNDEYGVVLLETDDGQVRTYNEKTGQLMQVNGEDIGVSYIDTPSGLMGCYDLQTGEKTLRLLEEDGSDFVKGWELSVSDFYTISCVDDETVLITDKGVSNLYDKKGNILHTFDTEVLMTKTSDGKRKFIGEAPDSNKCIVYNEKYENVLEIENAESPEVYDGYYTIKRTDTQVKDLYGEDDKIIFENVSVFTRENQYMDVEGNVCIETKMQVESKNDEITYYKPNGKNSLLPLPEGEQISTFVADCIVCSNDEEWIVRDEDLEEITRFDNEIDIYGYGTKGLFVEGDGEKYYSYDGDLLFNKEN